MQGNDTYLYARVTRELLIILNSIMSVKYQWAFVTCQNETPFHKSFSYLILSTQSFLLSFITNNCVCYNDMRQETPHYEPLDGYNNVTLLKFKLLRFTV